MNWRLSSWRTEIWLFVGAFGIRVLYALVIQAVAGEHGFISFSDAEYFYYAAAKNMLIHHVFSVAQSAPFIPDAYHTPLYPLFVALLLLMRLPLLGVVIVQDILAALTVVFIYGIALKLTNSSRIALVAGILASIEPMSIYWSGLLMSDVFFTFFAVWSMYLLLKENYIASGFALGFAALARPVALFFLPAYMLFVFYQEYVASRDFRTCLKNTSAITVMCLVVVSPWFVRNKIVFNTWSLTSGGWYDLYVESVGTFAEQHDISLPPVNAGTGVSRFSFAYTPEFQAADISVIKQNIPAFFFYQAKRSLWSLVSDRYEYLFNVVFKSQIPSLYRKIPTAFISALLLIGEIFWLGILALTLISFSERKLLPWWFFFSVLVAINALISGGINPGGTDMSRYSLPFYAFFFTFAGVGFVQLRGLFVRFTGRGTERLATRE